MIDKLVRSGRSDVEANRYFRFSFAACRLLRHEAFRAKGNQHEVITASSKGERLSPYSWIWGNPLKCVFRIQQDTGVYPLIEHAWPARRS